MVCVVSCAYLEGDRFITTVLQQQSETSSETYASTSKVDRTDPSSNNAANGSGIFHRLFYGPRDQHYLSVLQFGTGPVSNMVEKCCNYVIWICANVLVIVRGESARSSTIRRNRRNRRRLATASSNVVPVIESHPESSPPENSAANSIFREQRTALSLGRILINNFSDSMSSTRSQDEESRSGTESTTQSTGLKKRKNVSKKNSNDSQTEPPHAIEPRLRPVIKVSGIQKQPAFNTVKKPDPKKNYEEPVVVASGPREEILEEVKQEIGRPNEEGRAIPIKEVDSSDHIDDIKGFQSNDEDKHSNVNEDDQINLSDSSFPEWADATIPQGINS